MAYPEHPLPLLTLTSNEDGTSKWEIPAESRSVLESIEDSITSVSIVGKYRGGKSYLMNVIGGRPGFAIGDTIQAQTKGIWMLPVKHPKEEGRCLLLLDTEGLHDAALGDINHDMQLFVFAILSSSCLIYNIKGALDQTFISELQMVTELTDKIRVRGGASNDDEEEEQALKSHIPELVVVVRDFHLALEVDGKPINPDEYFESILELKRGTSKKVTDYNLPRKCIRQYFQRRRCVTLPKPVQDDSKMKNLAKLPKEELDENFTKQTEELVEYIRANVKTMTADSHPLSSQGFLVILGAYVDAVNDNVVPCIESAVESMKRQESQRALENAQKLYQKGMQVSLEGNMPIETADLGKLDTEHKEKAVEEYRRIVRIEEEAEDLNQMFEREFQAFSSENNESSLLASQEAISKCFEVIIEGRGSERYYQNGGHAAFRTDLEDAQSKYISTISLGPLKDEELKRKMEEINTLELAIIKADEALSKKDKEVAQKNQELQAQEAEAKKKEKELQEKNLEMERQHQNKEQLFEKYKTDQEEKEKKEKENHENQLKDMQKEMEIMKEKGLKQQAEEMKAQIMAFEQERLKMAEESNKRAEKMEEMRTAMVMNHQEAMAKMTNEHHTRVEAALKQQTDHQQRMEESDKKFRQDQAKWRIDAEERQNIRDQEERTRQELRYQAEEKARLEREDRQERQDKRDKEERDRRENDRKAEEKERRDRQDGLEREHKAELAQKDADRAKAEAEAKRLKEEKNEKGLLRKAWGQMFQREFQAFSSENNESSLLASQEAISKCFEVIIEGRGSERYYQNGGHAAFRTDLEDAQSKYNSTTSLGPLKDEELKRKMEEINTLELAIIKADEALSKKDKEVAQKNQELQAQEAEAKKKEKELQEKYLEMERQHQNKEQLFEKYKTDQVEKEKKEKENHENQVKDMQKEMEIMKEKGLKQQAEEMKAQIMAFEQERLKMAEESSKRAEEMEEMRTAMIMNHQEAMTKVTNEHHTRVEASLKQQTEHQQRMEENDKKFKQDQEKWWIEAQERRDKRDQEERVRLEEARREREERQERQDKRDQEERDRRENERKAEEKERRDRQDLLERKHKAELAQKEADRLKAEAEAKRLKEEQKEKEQQEKKDQEEREKERKAEEKEQRDREDRLEREHKAELAQMEADRLKAEAEAKRLKEEQKEKERQEKRKQEEREKERKAEEKERRDREDRQEREHKAKLAQVEADRLKAEAEAKRLMEEQKEKERQEKREQEEREKERKAEEKERRDREDRLDREHKADLDKKEADRAKAEADANRLKEEQKDKGFLRKAWGAIW